MICRSPNGNTSYKKHVMTANTTNKETWSNPQLGGAEEQKASPNPGSTTLMEEKPNTLPKQARQNSMPMTCKEGSQPIPTAVETSRHTVTMNSERRKLWTVRTGQTWQQNMNGYRIEMKGCMPSPSRKLDNLTAKRCMTHWGGKYVPPKWPTMGNGVTWTRNMTIMEGWPASHHPIPKPPPHIIQLTPMTTSTGCFPLPTDRDTPRHTVTPVALRGIPWPLRKTE